VIQQPDELDDQQPVVTRMLQMMCRKLMRERYEIEGACDAPLICRLVYRAKGKDRQYGVCLWCQDEHPLTPVYPFGKTPGRKERCQVRFQSKLSSSKFKSSKFYLQPESTRNSEVPLTPYEWRPPMQEKYHCLRAGASSSDDYSNQRNSADINQSEIGPVKYPPPIYVSMRSSTARSRAGVDYV